MPAATSVRVPEPWRCARRRTHAWFDLAATPPTIRGARTERCSCGVKGRARSGQDRDRPLVVEGRLLVGHGPREGLLGGGRQFVR